MVSGGVPPYTWSVTAGALPAGLVIRTDPAPFLGSATAGIVGVASTPGTTASFTLTVTDSQSHSASQASTMGITSLAITDNNPLPDGFVGVAYSYTLHSSGASGAVTWGVANGLPPGLSLNTSTGQITGTPTTSAVGNYGFAITATDSTGTIGNGYNLYTDRKST